MKHLLALAATAVLALPAHAQAPDAPAPAAGTLQGPVVIRMERSQREGAPPREIRIVTTEAGDGKGEPERVITRRILRDAFGEPDAVTIDRIGPEGRGPGPRGPGMMGEPGRGALAQALIIRRDRGLGLQLATVSPRLGSYFGAKAGVLVIHSENAAFKIEDGDIITAIDGRQPTTAQQARRILASYAPGEKIGFKLVRDRKPLSLDVVVPEPPKVVNFELRRDGGAHDGAHAGPQGGVAPAPKAP